MMSQKKMWKDCKIRDACEVILGGYPRGIPERCLECTDLVKFTVSCMVLDASGVKENNLWGE